MLYLLAYFNLCASFLVCKLLSKFVYVCLTEFLCGIKLYVICFWVLLYDSYMLTLLIKVICTYILFESNVHSACELHFIICICSVRSSMCYVEKHNKNKIIIIIYERKKEQNRNKEEIVIGGQILVLYLQTCMPIILNSWWLDRQTDNQRETHRHRQRVRSLWGEDFFFCCLFINL